MRGHYGQRILDALDRLHRIQQYLEAQWGDDFDRPHAKANLEARFIVFQRQQSYLVECGIPPITYEEIAAVWAAGVWQ